MNHTSTRSSFVALMHPSETRRHGNTTVCGPSRSMTASSRTALFLILEMSEPFAGLMQIPSTQLRNALAPIGP